MFSFMIEHGENNSYQEARKRSVQLFASRDPAQMARLAGGIFLAEDSAILLPSLGQLLRLTYPSGKVNFKGTPSSPLWQWSLLATNYLGRADGTALTGELISFREVESGQVFHPAFQNSALSRLARIAESNPSSDINNAFLQLGGELQNKGDAGAKFHFFPRFPITALLWKGDEELPSSASMLFDTTANCYLHTEDIAVAGELLSYFLSMLCTEA